MNSRSDRLIALSGVSRAALWAHQLASKGEYNPVRVQQAVDTILCTEPDAAADVFGGYQDASIPKLEEGLELLRAQLGGQPLPLPRPEIALMTRYFGQMLRLASHLQKDRDRLQTIADAIDRIHRTDEVAGTGPINQPSGWQIPTRPRSARSSPES